MILQRSGESVYIYFGIKTEPLRTAKVAFASGSIQGGMYESLMNNGNDQYIQPDNWRI